MTAAPESDHGKRRLLFRLGSEVHAIDAGRVLEVLPLPHITRVPHGPPALAGIANLRGQPLPVMSVERLLSRDPQLKVGLGGKIIVYDHGGAVGLLVDDVMQLSQASGAATELLALDDLLEGAFKLEKRAGVARAYQASQSGAAAVSASLSTFLSFRVAGQLYALPLESVREVATLSGELATLPNADEAVLGIMSMRDAVLPVVSLAGLLGLQLSSPEGAGSRIIVIEHDKALVGLVVSELDMIRRLPRSAIDTVPAVLQRGRGTAEIDAIGRVDNGAILISILSPGKLFGHATVSQVIDRNIGASTMAAASESRSSLEQFLLFRLAEETYGLPIAAVDEVIRVPNDVTRMPGAPSFVSGIINLRGKAVPLIDQRTRFDLAETTSGGQARAIILTIGALQAGFVVDSVSEVKAVAAEALSAAPEFASDQTEVFDRVAHFEAEGRMVLIVNPQELLSKAERDVVAAIAGEKTAVKPT
jgi:purine-binding chemotaxis protein CheW